MKLPKRNNRLRIVTWLIYLVLVSVLIGTVTLAKYSTTISGTGEATIASMNMDSVSLSFCADHLKAPGDTDTMTFRVVNFEGANICEVKQNYTITVDSTGNLPLTFELTGNTDDGSNTNDHKGQVISENSVSNGVPIGGGSMEHTYKTVHDYSLKVTWPSTEKDVNLAGEIDLISITVNAEQAL